MPFFAGAAVVVVDDAVEVEPKRDAPSLAGRAVEPAEEERREAEETARGAAGAEAAVEALRPITGGPAGLGDVAGVDLDDVAGLFQEEKKSSSSPFASDAGLIASMPSTNIPFEKLYDAQISAPHVIRS